MPSNKETLFQDHVCDFLSKEHNYETFESSRLQNANHFIEEDVINSIKATQENKYQELVENFGSDADREIIKALENEVAKKALWLIIREGLTVKGTKVQLYTQKPRSNTSKTQADYYELNKFV